MHAAQLDRPEVPTGFSPSRLFDPAIPFCASLDSLPAAAAFVDRDGTILDANPTFCGLIESARLQDARWMEAVDRADQCTLRRIIRTVDDSHGTALVRLFRAAAILPTWFVASAGARPSFSGFGARKSAIRLVSLHHPSDAFAIGAALVGAHRMARERALPLDAMQVHFRALSLDLLTRLRCHAPDFTADQDQWRDEDQWMEDSQ